RDCSSPLAASASDIYLDFAASADVQDISLLAAHHGSMAPKPQPSTSKGTAKGKVKNDAPQASTIDFGLPPSVATALQSIATRTTQDLWATSAFQNEALTAEQLAQRRSNQAVKLSKRITGDTKAKHEMRTALAEWFSRISQHLVGLTGRVRAISNRLDEDLTMAVQEMQQYLIEQPSASTEEQLAAANRAMGPTWSAIQEPEVVRLAASLKAFGVVQPEPAVLSASSSAAPPTMSFRTADQGSEMSFGEGGAAEMTPAEPNHISRPPPLVTTQGPRWKRRASVTGQRPSKSPRREPHASDAPWCATATGRTPEGLKRSPVINLAEDDQELLPDLGTTPPTLGPSMTWLQSWQQLASFAVEYGAEYIGALCVDEAQNAAIPLPDPVEDLVAVTDKAEQVWQSLRDCVAKKSEQEVFPVCTALYQVLQLLRQHPTALPQDPPPSEPTFTASPDHAVGPTHPVRDLCVFDTSASGPICCQVEVRMQGVFLYNAICVALAHDRLTSRCHNLRSSLPGLPSEQYVISSTLQHWSEVTTPVDLRPLGGRITTHAFPCTATGRDVLTHAAAVQLLPLPVEYYCQVGDCILQLEAQVLLLEASAAVRGLLRSDFCRVTPSAPIAEEALLDAPVLPPTSDLQPRSVAVLYRGGILLHDVGDAIPNDSGRARTMREVRDELGLTEPVFLCPQTPLADLPNPQLVAVELEEVDRTVLVDMRGIGGSVTFATVLPAATALTCIFEADVPLFDWSIQQALPVLIRSGWVRVADSAVHRPLPSEGRGVRVISLGWQVLQRASPPEADDAIAPDVPSSAAPCFSFSFLAGLIPLLACSEQRRAIGLIGLGLLSLALTHGHPDEMWLSPESHTRQTIFRGTSDLASISEHHRYAALLHLQPAEALPPAHLVLDNPGRADSMLCVQVWTPDHTQQVLLLATELSTQLSHRLRLTDPTGLRRVPALVMPQPEWPCLQFVAPSRDPDFVTILVDVGHSVFCFDVTRSRLAADLFQQLRDRCGHNEFRINRGLVASVRHGEMLRVFPEAVASTYELGRISLQPQPPPSATWLGQDTHLYVVGPFLDLIRVSPAPAEPFSALPQLLYSAHGVDGVLYRLPPLPAGYKLPAPVFCLSPPDLGCHLVLATDSLGHWHRFAIQASLHTSSPGDALDDLAINDRTHQAFWRKVRDSMPVLYSVPDQHRGHPTLSLLIIDTLRAYQFGVSFTHHEEPETLQAAISPRVEDYRATGTQTNPGFWPATAAAISSSAVPQLPAVRSCIPLPQLCPDGPYVQLDCPRFNVQCLLPCLPGYSPWALRIGLAVFGVCTAEVTWQHVLTITEANPWDLSGMEIMGETELWAWPNDVGGLAGQCGHLLQSGSDPFLCFARASRPATIRTGVPGSNHTTLSGGTDATSASQRAALPALGFLVILGTHFLQAHSQPIIRSQGSLIFSIVSLLALLARGAPEDLGGPNVTAEDPIIPLADSTRTCTVAWGHELSCQTTGFAVTVVEVLDYIRQVSPDVLVRAQLWLPYNGPAAFEFSRSLPSHEFQPLLQAAGHHPDRTLSVAYDTLGTSLDLLSIPQRPATWWIVRDGLSRELLRPVTLWTEPGARYVLTLNSHGQAQALSCSPEVARLTRLPQGVRATVTLPFTTTIGHMTTNGLVLQEVAIGAIAGASRLRIAGVVLVAWWLGSFHSVAAMQNTLVPQELAVQPRHYASSPEPTITRIWTYSCEAPVEVPFAITPDLTRMHRQIEGTGRGIPPAGDFVWTSPRIIQGRAHILHFPPRTSPPYVFWLIHYRARGHVIAASDQAFDWALVGALAADAFGEPWFGQGFGIVQQGRVIQYGEAIGIPPHGAIIHLVRTSLQPRLGYTGWEAPADPGCVFPFDYDICLGARGGQSIALDRYDVPQRTAAQVARPNTAGSAADCEDRRPAQHLERQLAEVSNDLQVLITRLESAGILPTPEVAPWSEGTTAPDTRAGSEPQDKSAAQATSRPLYFALLLGLPLASLQQGPGMQPNICSFIGVMLWHAVGAQAQDHDRASSSEEQEPSEPSSPSLLQDVSAPTPLTLLSEVPGATPVVLPSSWRREQGLIGEATEAPYRRDPKWSDLRPSRGLAVVAVGRMARN
ncbi:unnamed protein product, partial [Symbiodinium sp. KB8]